MYQNARKTDIETHKENMALNNRCDDGMDTRMDYTQPQSPRVQPGQRKLTFCGQLDSHYLQGQDKNIMGNWLGQHIYRNVVASMVCEIEIVQ